MIPVQKGLRVFQREGALSFISRGGLYVGRPFWNTVTSRYPIGTNIFDRDWDLLIILDTCRVDALRSLSKSISWLDQVGRMRSVGSMSAEWILNTFTKEYRKEISRTAFVSGNIWSHRIFNQRFHDHDRHDYDNLHRGYPKWQPVTADAFAHYETVSAVENQDDQIHPENEAIPHILTDRAIAVGRKTDVDRMIVHYTLPHLTFIADAIDWSPGGLSQTELMAGPDAIRDLNPEEKSYDAARRGDVTHKTVYESYLQNLRLGIEYVEILLQNIIAETAVITADHGEAFGEKGVWGHPYGFPFAPVKTVPWAETTATDERTYESRYDPLKRSPTEHESAEFLKRMGYL